MYKLERKEKKELEWLLTTTRGGEWLVCSYSWNDVVCSEQVLVMFLAPGSLCLMVCGRFRISIPEEEGQRIIGGRYWFKWAAQEDQFHFAQSGPRTRVENSSQTMTSSGSNVKEQEEEKTRT